MLKTRVATALMLAPLVLAAMFLLSPMAWAIAMLVATMQIAWEWARLSNFTLPTLLVFVAGVALACLCLLYAPVAGFARGWPTAVVASVCGVSAMFWIAVAPAWVIGRWTTRKSWAMVPAGWVVLIGAWLALVELQARSPWLVLAAMAIVWIADTAAYFAGRAFGRRKLAPLVSPGKTWEGVYGGLVAVAVYALCLVPLARDAHFTGEVGALSVVLWLALALLSAGISVLGDLFESLMKRHAGVKDSGRLLPGHGGVFDRTDALLAAMPLAALAAQLFLTKT